MLDLSKSPDDFRQEFKAIFAETHNPNPERLNEKFFECLQELAAYIAAYGFNKSISYKLSPYVKTLLDIHRDIVLEGNIGDIECSIHFEILTIRVMESLNPIIAYALEKDCDLLYEEKINFIPISIDGKLHNYLTFIRRVKAERMLSNVFVNQLLGLHNEVIECAGYYDGRRKDFEKEITLEECKDILSKEYEADSIELAKKRSKEKREL